MAANNLYPSIFNDVIGPVMRGPSSSHCAASLRIGRMARELMAGDIEEVLIHYDPNGSIAHTHRTQGSDMGLTAGFLGWEPDDERLPEYESAARAAGLNIHIEIKGFNAPHPNTYKLTLKNRRESHQMTAVSSGGGMIEILDIDGVPVSMTGDYYETLIYHRDDEKKLLEHLAQRVTADHILSCTGKESRFIELKSRQFPDHQVLAQLSSDFKITGIKKLSPVLPVLSYKDMNVPFITCAEMLDYNRDKHLDLWELAVHYERARGNISNEEVVQKMEGIAGIMKQSIAAGLQGTHYNNRVLGVQSGGFKRRMESKGLLEGGMLNRMILYTTAMMEVKSSLGVIVACPTAGSCAGLPGACFGAADWLGLPGEDVTRALLAAGLIGVFIAAHSTFAAEVGGCQAECGAASGMAAAALVSLGKGSTEQAIAAASMALQNIFGMVCDPVANRVEVPCLGKNVMAASNALSCANMALADFDPVIPLDQVIAAMDKVGKSLPYELRCTALGGLSITDASKKIEERLARAGY